MAQKEKDFDEQGNFINPYTVSNDTQEEEKTYTDVEFEEVADPTAPLPESDIEKEAEAETKDITAPDAEQEQDPSRQEQIEDVLGDGVFDMATARIVGGIADRLLNDKDNEKEDTFLDWGTDDKPEQDNDKEPNVELMPDDKADVTAYWNAPEQVEEADIEVNEGNLLEWNDGGDKEKDPDKEQTQSLLEWNDDIDDHDMDI